MAACSQCGQPNVSGRFCGSCGAPVPAQPPGPAPAQPPVGPSAYPQSQHAVGAQAPKRSNGLLIALGVIGGIVVLGFIGLLILASFVEDEPVPAAAPAQEQGQTTANQPTEPAAPPVPAAPPANPLGVQWAQKEMPGVKLLSKGQISEGFLRVQGFRDGLVLARRDNAGNTEALTMYYENGQFLPSMLFMAPVGGDVLQLTTGDLMNAGAQQAMVLSSKGMILIDDAEEWEQIETEGISNLLVADWDGDSLHEMAVFYGSQTNGRLRRFTEAGGWVTLGEFPRDTLPPNAVMSRLTINKRQLLLGDVRGAQGPELNLALYTLDATKGFEPVYTYKVPQLQTPTSFGAAMLNGKPTIVVAHAGQPSYLALYEILDATVEPLGIITLPDNGHYQVLLGSFSDPGVNEILAIDSKGRWVLHGF